MSEVGLKYNGLGHIVGIPARDLTPEEIEELGGEQFLLSRQNGHGGKMYSKPPIAKQSKKQGGK